MKVELASAVLFLSVACSPAVHGGLALDEPRNALRRAETATLEEWKRNFTKRAFRTKSGEVLPYRIARPATSSPRPLILVLHGSGAIGSDNEGQLGPFAASWAQLLSDRDAPIVVVPQVARRSADYLLCDWSPCASLPGPSFDALLQLLDTLAANPEVDVRRIYVVGFSMGASAALQLALARPKLISAMVVFAPVPPSTARIAELTTLPILAVHGSRDGENPFQVMHTWTNALNAAGGRARLCVRDGMGHQVPDDMLKDAIWRRRLLQGGVQSAKCQ